MAELRVLCYCLIFLLQLVHGTPSIRNERSTIDCGIPYDAVGHVYNGRGIRRYEHPWKAALTTLNQDGSEDYNYFCGGVLIDNETVVTAAHCLVQSSGRVLPARDIIIMLGAYNITKAIEPGRVYAPVKSIEIHNKWNPSSGFDGDLAVLKLVDPVIYNKFIRPVCVANPLTSSIIDGTVVGWGYHDDSDKPSPVARAVDIPILDTFDCLQMNNGLLKIITKTMFCAGKKGAGVCKGDSGSGYFVQYNGKFYLRGLVSSSTLTKCSQSDTVLYSDILQYLDFFHIHSNMISQSSVLPSVTMPPKKNERPTSKKPNLQPSTSQEWKFPDEVAKTTTTVKPLAVTCNVDGKKGECIPYYLCNNKSNNNTNDGSYLLDIGPTVANEACIDYFEVCCVPEYINIDESAILDIRP